jgi:hypothetical protein
MPSRLFLQALPHPALGPGARPPLVGDEQIAYFFNNGALPLVNSGTFGAVADLTMAVVPGTNLKGASDGGTCVSFDGVNGFAEGGAYDPQVMPDTRATLTAILNPSTSGTAYFMLTQDPITSAPAYAIRLDAIDNGGGQYKWQASYNRGSGVPGVSTYMTYTSGNAFNYGDTAVVAFVIDEINSAVRLYVNGVIEASDVLVGTQNIVYLPDAGIFVGYNAGFLATPTPLGGSVYDIRLVGTARANKYITTFTNTALGI